MHRTLLSPARPLRHIAPMGSAALPSVVSWRLPLPSRQIVDHHGGHDDQADGNQLPLVADTHNVESVEQRADEDSAGGHETGLGRHRQGTRRKAMPSHRRRRETRDVPQPLPFKMVGVGGSPSAALPLLDDALAMVGVAAPGIRRNGSGNVAPAITRTGS